MKVIYRLCRYFVLFVYMVGVGGMYGRRGDVRETKVSNGERQVVLVWTKPSNIHTAPLCIHGSVDKLCGAMEQQDCAVMTTSSSI